MSTPLIPLSKQVSRVWDSGTNNPHSLFAQSANQCLQRINNQLELKSCVLLSSSTLCINTNLINPSFLTGVWEHAVRRQEDQTVGLANLSEGLPHLLPAAVGQFPAAATPVLIAAANFLSPLSPSLCLGIDDDGGLQSATFTASAYQDIDQVSRCPIFAAFYSTVKEKEKKYLSCKSAFSAYKLCSGRTIDSVTDYGSWYIGLRQCGMDKNVVREILSTLHGIMLIGNHEKSREDYEEGCSMVGLIPSAIEELPRETIVVALFNRLVVRMINCVNESLAKVFGQEFSDDAAAVINLVEMDCKCHQTKIQLLRATFSDDFSINSEMINDGLHVPRAPKYIEKEMKSIVLSEEDADEKENQLSEDSQFVGEHLNSEFSFLSGVQDLVPSDMNFGHLMNTTRVWTVYGVETGDITDTAESWFFEDYVNRATEVDYTADFTHDEFFSIYSDQLFGIGIGQLTDWARGAKGWASSEFAVGNERIWVSEQAWNYLEASKDCEQQYSLGGSDYGEESVIPYDCSFEDYEVDSLNREYLDRPTAADYGYDTEAVGQQTLQKLSGRRKLWLVIVKLLTWWIPSPLLSIGGMKRSEVRIAWREKVAICILIALANILILFYMIFFAKLLCPDYDHVWGPKDVSQHQGPDDFFVSIHGKVYDLSKFYKLQHSDSNVKTNSDQMLMFAGQDVSPYFPKPLSMFCPDLVKGEDIWLTPNKTVHNENAVHYSGSKAPDKDSALASKNWYTESLEPALKSMYKGDLVYTRKNVTEQGDGGYNYWAIVYGKIYDLTDYFHTLERETDEKYEFLDKRVSRLFMQHAGEDITDKLKNLDVRRSVIESNLRCISNVFYSGGLDYRDSIRCQFSNYLLLVIAIIMCSAIVVKFIAAFQLGTKKVPNMCDRFVICHFPVYTEGEDEIRRALDSITALEYPNDRKLLFVVCDGMVVGSGNDLPTPHVLLNILGNTAGTNQSTHAFQSVGKGSKQLNYGQVYSGIYENNGNVVPYLVVVKIGAPSETSKPGNRGKRDSQLLVMNFFNRVHFQDRMNPLQLELFHHLNNIVGVDPELYEYLLMVDADTQVAPDSLNRLVSSCVYDTRIAG